MSVYIGYSSEKNVKYHEIFVQKSVYLEYGTTALQGFVGVEGV